MTAYDLFNFYQNSFKQLYLTRIVNGSNPPRHTLYIQAAELCNYSIYFFTQIKTDILMANQFTTNKQKWLPSQCGHVHEPSGRRGGGGVKPRPNFSHRNFFSEIYKKDCQ